MKKKKYISTFIPLKFSHFSIFKNDIQKPTLRKANN